MRRARLGAAAVVLLAALAVTMPAEAGSPGAGGGNDVAAHWTAARMAAATPRDLVLDERGLAYLRRADGTLEPHGHSTGQLYASPAPASRPTPAGKPSGGDTTGPSVTLLSPANGATVGASQAFSATATDPSGVRSVTVVIVPSSGPSQSFAAAASGSTWSVTISGFTAGSWSWYVVAKDGARGGGNTTTSSARTFTVDGGGGGGGGGGTTVTNSAWTGGNPVQNAAGRIYFEMPSNQAGTIWSGYVCSGTVARDGVSGRSIIITAGHCVYDDEHKVFARNVIFIPNQDGTSGTGTDRNCSNDPMGCWTTSFGVVDTDWSSRIFPNNIPWDYAYYVVNDTGAHTAGLTAASDTLDSAAGDMAVQVGGGATTGVFTHALGYSYSQDPNFMYCAENVTTEGSYGDWWLAHCGLSGGASGGPWVQPMTNGDGPIISVNSWGYTNQPGMAGPLLTGSAGCVFQQAKTQSFATVSNRGVTFAC